jgi:hypothetical protein
MKQRIYQHLLCLSLASVSAASIACAQSREEGPWWPHPIWGPTDQTGASNWITPEKILEAVSLVSNGNVYELGHVYERGMPLLGDRSYSIVIPGFPTNGPVGDNQLVFNDEFIATQIGQIGTQFDGLGHVGRRMTMADGRTTDVYYNGFTAEEMADPYELQRLGVENVKPIFTRGFLIDIAGFKGVHHLPESYEISLDDVKGALSRQNISEDEIRPGDALLFNQGWWQLWPDPITHDQSIMPFASREVVDWIIERKPAVVGSDLALDGPALDVHRMFVLEQGINNLEMLTFDGLLADGVQEFLFIVTPLRIKGATGSPVRPIAIH